SARKRARLERKSKSAHHHKKKEKKKSKRSARHQKKRSGRRSKSSSSDSSSTDSDTDSKDSSSYDDSSTYDSSEDGYNEELDTVKNFHPNGKGWRSKERLKAAAEAFGAEVRRHPAPPWLNKLLDHTVSMAIYLFEDNRRSLKMRRRASVAASKNFLLALQVYGRSRGIEDRDVEREVAGLSSKDRKSPRKVVRAFRKALMRQEPRRLCPPARSPIFPASGVRRTEAEGLFLYQRRRPCQSHLGPDCGPDERVASVQDVHSEQPEEKQTHKDHQNVENQIPEAHVELSWTINKKIRRRGDESFNNAHQNWTYPGGDLVENECRYIDPTKQKNPKVGNKTIEKGWDKKGGSASLETHQEVAANTTAHEEAVPVHGNVFSSVSAPRKYGTLQQPAPSVHNEAPVSPYAPQDRRTHWYPGGPHSLEQDTESGEKDHQESEEAHIYKKSHQLPGKKITKTQGETTQLAQGRHQVPLREGNPAGRDKNAHGSHDT
ncbi:unnamed protein product, partial [Bodo saltans]